MKKVAVVLFCTILGSTLYARDDISKSSPFIGLEVGYATVQGDVGGFFPGKVVKDYEGSDVEYGIRIGAKKDKWRATLSFNYFDGKEDGKEQNYEKYLASVDYLFLASSENMLQPFLGLNAGYINYESTNDIDMNGFLYGAQVGAIASITDSIDLDLMYRYSLSSATEEDRNAALDHIGSIVFGLNYLY